MTAPGDVAARRPSRSGARLLGDDVQHLVALHWAVRAIEPDEPIASIEVEAVDGGNADDVVIHWRDGRVGYQQVKASVDASKPLGSDWLLSPSRTGGPSILQRFKAHWDTVRDDAGSTLALVTTRSIDPNDPVLKLRDHTETVAAPLARASARSVAGKARRAWAGHLGVDEDELVAFLRDLRFETDGSEASWQRRVQAVLRAAGMRDDLPAVLAAVGAVRNWVKDGRRLLTPDGVRDELTRLELRRSPPAALVVVEEVDRHPAGDRAQMRLDWRDCFLGDTPHQRRAPRSPTDWSEVLYPQLQGLAPSLRAAGHSRVLVRGAARLPTWMAIGQALADVAGFTVSCDQRGQLWSSDDEPAVFDVARVEDRSLGDGADLAVGVFVAADCTDDAAGFLSTAGFPVGRFVGLAPAGGASGRCLTDGGAALGAAMAVRDEVRRLVREQGSSLLHLFLAAPHGFALLLGWLWDRLPATQLYTDLGTRAAYAPAFRLPGAHSG